LNLPPGPADFYRYLQRHLHNQIQVLSLLFAQLLSQIHGLHGQRLGVDEFGLSLRLLRRGRVGIGIIHRRISGISVGHWSAVRAHHGRIRLLLAGLHSGSRRLGLRRRRSRSGRAAHQPFDFLLAQLAL